MDSDDLPAPRFPLEVDVDFRKSYGRELYKGTLKNISSSGAFLENSIDEVQNADKLNLEINLSGRSRQLLAEVVWKNKRGCGIKFSAGQQKDIQIVDDLIFFLESKQSEKKDILKLIFEKL